VQRVPVAIAVTISSTHPIMVGLLCRLLWGEPFRGWRALGALMAVLGTSAIGWDTVEGSERGLWGYACALGAAFFFSVYMILGQRLRANTGFVRYLLPTYGISALCLLLGVMWSGLPLTGYSNKTLFMFALLALVPTAVGHSSLNWALGHVSATLVAVSALGEPLGATVLAWAILGETVGPWKMFWGALILGGIYLTAKGETWGKQRDPANSCGELGPEGSSTRQGRG